MSAEPRLRVSALLRWNDGLLLCRHEKPGKEYWLLPGGGVNAGESLVDALDRELAEELGLDGVAVEGPVAICESIAPVQDPAAKHVVHIVFAGDLSRALARGGHVGRRGRPRAPSLRARRARRNRPPSTHPALSPPLGAR